MRLGLGSHPLSRGQTGLGYRTEHIDHPSSGAIKPARSVIGKLRGMSLKNPARPEAGWTAAPGHPVGASGNHVRFGRSATKAIAHADLHLARIKARA